MRLSPLKHTLAVLRTTIGLTQKEMGELVHRAARTIQAVELGQLPLSEDLALEIAEATGVDAGWLLENDPQSPPRKGMTAMGMGFGTGEFGRAEFEFHRAFLESPVAATADVQALYQTTLSSGKKKVTMTLPVLKKVMLAKKKEMLQNSDHVMVRNLQDVLKQTIISKYGDLIRWKINQLLQSLCEEYQLSALSSDVGYDPDDMEKIVVHLPVAKAHTTGKKIPTKPRKNKAKVHFSFPIGPDDEPAST